MAAQYAKAIAIADHLYEMSTATGVKLHPDEVEAISPEDRKKIAAAAKVNPPSLETWGIVVAIVKARGDCFPHRFGAEGVCLDCGLNPFEGIFG